MADDAADDAAPAPKRARTDGDGDTNPPTGPTRQQVVCLGKTSEPAALGSLLGEALSARPPLPDCWRKYQDANVLAPMVRVGHLPLRLLALDYGANMVYSPETIDRRLMSCRRETDAVTQVTSFVDHDNKKLLQTCDLERDAFVVQIGTNDPANALKAAEVVANDCCAIDVNMGCPKAFSTQGAMGSRLLKDPERARDIMTTLRRNLPSNIHVTCKIRLLETSEETVSFAKQMENCGISALGVHARYVPQRPREPAHWKLVKPVVEALSIPVILSGDVYCYEEFAQARDDLGVAAAMTARGAQWNASIFRKDGFLPSMDVRKALLQKCALLDHTPQLVKFTIQEMMMAPGHFYRAKSDAPVMKLNTPLGRRLTESKSLREICDAHGLVKYFDAAKALRERRATEGEARGLHPLHAMHAEVLKACESR